MTDDEIHEYAVKATRARYDMADANREDWHRLMTDEPNEQAEAWEFYHGVMKGILIGLEGK